jgi:hypothetical protein
MRTHVNWFERGVLFSKKYFHWIFPQNQQTQKKLLKHFPEEYNELLSFSDLRVDRSDILLFAYTAAFLSFFVLVLCCVSIVAIYYMYNGGIEFFYFVGMTVTLVAVPFVIINLIAQYPKTYARYLQIRSLGDIPEVLCYFVMSLKIVPNLETAVRFTASKSSTTLAGDLRKLIWDMEIRLHHGITDAMTDFTIRWGRVSDYFKRSLHLLCSSLQEKDEASRVITLDRALDVSLEGTKETMTVFANRLHQPTVVLYSLGIMIPLSLVAMLPAAGLVGVKISLLQVFCLYDVLLPVCIFFYIRKILRLRPAAFQPCQIPRDHPDVQRGSSLQLLFLSVFLGCLIASPAVLILIAPLLPPLDIPSGVSDLMSMAAMVQSFFPVTLFLLWGIAVAVSSYCLGVYRPYKKIRDEIKQMEKEFSDALYILGKRISEEKSPEECFSYTADTMQGSKIAEVFRQVSYTLIAMHTNIHDALYDSEYGALQHVYSDRIKAILYLFVEGTKKSQQAVSASLVRIADHLQQLQEVEKKIVDMLAELTSTVRSTVTMFAPLIAGITLAITFLISRILATIHFSGSPEIFTGLPVSVQGLSQTFMVENIHPDSFVFVIGIYILELVVLLTRFVTGLNEGDDTATFFYTLGKTLPLSLGVFTVTVSAGLMFFSCLVP